MKTNIRHPTNFVITPRLGGMKRRNFHHYCGKLYNKNSVERVYHND